MLDGLYVGAGVVGDDSAEVAAQVTNDESVCVHAGAIKQVDGTWCRYNIAQHKQVAPWFRWLFGRAELPFFCLILELSSLVNSL